MHVSKPLRPEKAPIFDKSIDRNLSNNESSGDLESHRSLNMNQSISYKMLCRHNQSYDNDSNHHQVIHSKLKEGPITIKEQPIW